MRLEAQVVVVRGAIAESRHRVQCAVVDRAGVLLAATEQPDGVTSFRSAAKPFQLLPLVERGHADALRCSDPELAIMAASHSGSRTHLALVRGLLARIGAGAADLACGYHEPMDTESLEDVRRDPSLRSPLYNNCSGKHAGMLALAKAEGWPIAGYEKRDHPLQALMLRTVAECCGVPRESVLLGVDGCSVPVFGLPLTAMALGYARLADAMGAARDSGLGERSTTAHAPARALALQRIGRAMASEPVTVEGIGRLATDLVLATRGRIVAKSGAEGLLLVAEPEGRDGPPTPRGIAIKCEDGAMRALGPAAVELLLALGVLSPAEADALPAHRRPPVQDAAGHTVGELEGLVRVIGASAAGAGAARTPGSAARVPAS
jgi:L-asparaginase II